MADHLIKESGVRPLLHSFAVEAIMDGNTIKVRTRLRLLHNKALATCNVLQRETIAFTSMGDK